MKTPPTPLPWYATGSIIQSAAINEDNYVCDVEGSSREDQLANAAYIVHACNAYPELVAAIKYAIEFGDDPLNYPIILKRLRAALPSSR